MNISQLTAVGIPMNKWTSLDGICKSLGGYNLFVAPKLWQFFFSSSDELFFLRKTKGKPIPLPIGKKPKEGWVEVLIDKKRYEMELSKGGYIDSENENIGLYHIIGDIYSINGIF